jgi:hypothetical protein
MIIENWEHFFKPEVRSSGRSLFTQGKVTIAQPSDTEIIVYIRLTPPLKVSFKTKSVSSTTLYVDCNCPAGKKDLFCKHVWAGLLATEEKNPDFFESTIEIEKKESLSKTADKPKPTAQSPAYEEKQAAYKEQQKEKQSLYRKIQYQKQKLRANEFKKKKKDLPEESEFPHDVEKALEYFSQNGFELREAMKKEIISTAKKKLARIFHPDLGGSHEEILELNKQTDILMGFIIK